MRHLEIDECNTSYKGPISNYLFKGIAVNIWFISLSRKVPSLYKERAFFQLSFCCNSKIVSFRDLSHEKFMKLSVIMHEKGMIFGSGKECLTMVSFGNFCLKIGLWTFSSGSFNSCWNFQNSWIRWIVHRLLDLVS